MGTALGTLLGTVLGTDLGSTRDVYQKLLYALSSFSGANYFATQPPPGGEVGVGTGTGAVVLAQLTAKASSSAQRMLFTSRTAGAVGWGIETNGFRDTIKVAFCNGSGAISGPTWTFTASDVGKIFLFVGWLDGALVRGLCNRAEPNAGTTFTGTYSASTAPTSIGCLNGNGGFPETDGIAVLATLTFRGTPSLANLQALCDITRAKGDVPTPAEWNYGVTHRWSLKDALVGLPVVDGQTAPASLADTVTGATVDRMDRAGAPVVKVIDTSVDGRKTYGAQGWSATTYLYKALHATSQTTGFHFVIRWRFDLGGISSTRMLLDCSSGTTGFQVLVNGATISAAYAWLRTWNAVGTQVDTPTTVGMLQTAGAGDAGIVYLCGFFDPVSQKIEFYANKTRQGTGTACVGHSDGSAPLYVGGRPSGLTPLGAQSIFDLSFGASPLTAGEISTMVDASEAAGTLVAIPGKTLARYVITSDVTENGGPDNGVPSTVRDRVGTDHLTRVGGLQVGTGSGIAKFDTAHYIQSVGASAPGVGTGFYAECLFDYVPAASLAETIFACSADQSYGTGFAFLQYFGTFGVFGGGQSIYGGALTPGPNHFALRYDGSVLRGYKNGAIVSTSASYTHTPSTSPVTFGIIRPSAPINAASAAGIRGGAYGAAIPSDAEIAAAASAALSAGKLVGIAGKTSKLWSLVDDVIVAGGKVPSLYAERISGGAPDRLVLIGAPLQVAQRAERIWGWEAA